MIDENRLADFFEQLNKLNISDENLKRLKKEYVANKEGVEYHGRLKVWLIDQIDAIQQGKAGGDFDNEAGTDKHVPDSPYTF